MKELKILERSVSIDTDKLSKGLCEMHNENPDMKLMLSFGMLDAKLCEIFDQQLAEQVKAKFSEHANDLFKDRIDRIKAFIDDCNNEIGKGVYRYAELVV